MAASHLGEYLGSEVNGKTFHLVRTGPNDSTAPNDSFILWSDGVREYYDLETDPYQLQSRHNDPVTLDERTYLANLVNQFKTCRGSSCASIEDAP